MKIAQWVSSILLLGMAAAVFVSPSLVHRVTGARPLERPDVTALDEPPKNLEREAGEIFRERNVVRVEIREAISVKDFMELYQLSGFAHVREELARQEALETLPDEHVLEAGRVYEIPLTEPADL